VKIAKDCHIVEDVFHNIDREGNVELILVLHLR